MTEKEITPGEMEAAIANLVDRYGRDAVVEMRELVREFDRKHCAHCGKPLDLPPFSRRRTCSNACRQAKRREDLEARAERDADRDDDGDRDGSRP